MKNGNNIDDDPPTSKRSNISNPRSTDLGTIAAKNIKTTSKMSHLAMSSFRATSSKSAFPHEDSHPQVSRPGVTDIATSTKSLIHSRVYSYIIA